MMRVFFLGKLREMSSITSEFDGARGKPLYALSRKDKRLRRVEVVGEYGAPGRAILEPLSGNLLTCDTNRSDFLGK
jgi:hypothetical protein